MSEKTFLVEIGTEELPPKALRDLGENFFNNIVSGLNAERIVINDPDNCQWYASPRRLACKFTGLATQQLNNENLLWGPPSRIALSPTGVLTKAGMAFVSKISSQVIDNSKEYTIDEINGDYDLLISKAYDGKEEKLNALIRNEPKNTSDILPGIIDKALKNLPIPKLMRWGASDVHFVRPVHTVTLLLGDKVIPATILGIQSDRVIRGHRFMGEPEFTIDNADQYPQILLERGKVIADYEQRKAKIKADAEDAARTIGGNADLSESLLEEVTSLVEWPVVLTAKFEEKFLAVPSEALVYTMKGDQKYFPVYANDGKLLPNFIFVANIESKDPQQIISGNEKVVRPRLADAEFFFNTDRKKRLEDNLPRLQTVLFQQQLGTLRDKTDRIQALAGWIAGQIGADVNHATRAGLLSKCDLMTNMVFEFTDTQGVMGMHYARHDGEAEDVAVALNEQYQPRFAGDDLPSNPVACALAIADKMDTLAGIFGIGQHPKGDKDPFALRRAALGVLRIIVEKNLNLDLQTLTEEAVRLYGDKLTNANVVDDVIDFMLGRFRAWYQDEGYTVDTIQAVLARRPTRPADFDARMKAVSHFRTLEAASALAAANKRVSNILAKSDETLNERVNAATLKEPEEIALAMQVVVLRDKLEPYFTEGRYQDALVELAELREPVDLFFEKVMVNVEDKELRVNRLSMLEKLRELFLRVADISLLQ
ncbi:glycine--tRNA ligase subunit beta [Citrobacter telavivensis]